jgi:hypothetical protein
MPPVARHPEREMRPLLMCRCSEINKAAGGTAVVCHLAYLFWQHIAIVIDDGVSRDFRMLVKPSLYFFAADHRREPRGPVEQPFRLYWKYTVRFPGFRAMRWKAQFWLWWLS